jgi:hypothetical protein
MSFLRCVGPDGHSHEACGARMYRALANPASLGACGQGAALRSARAAWRRVVVWAAGRSWNLIRRQGRLES